MFFNPFFRFDGMDDSLPDMSFGRSSFETNNDHLYNVLGVSRDATESEIKRAYYSLAKKHHPDRGGDAAEFQEIQAAYDVLSNSERRQKYDLTGDTTIDEDPKKVYKTDDIRKEVYCSLEDLYHGKSFNMKITRKVVCMNCHGEGGFPGYRTPCRYCNGKGTNQMEVMDFFTSRIVEIECRNCRGKGALFNLSLQCPVCHGNRVVSGVKEASIYLRPGMGNGSEIHIPQAADEAPGLAAGDVVLAIKERSHPTFSRKGADLMVRVSVTLGEALCGFTKQLQHLSGKMLQLRAAPCQVTPGAVLVLPNEGMPVEGSLTQYGALYVEFSVEFPQSMAPEQVDSLRTLFNVPPSQALPHMEILDLLPQTAPFGSTEPSIKSPKEAYEEDSVER